MASFSVVIPSYNRAHTLPASVQSLLDQETRPGEIIVVDDGSTDGTRDLAILHHPLITYVRNEANLGKTYSRNRGAFLATSKYLGFLDSDDTVRPMWSRTLLGLIDETTKIAACGVRRLNMETGREEIRLPRHYSVGMFRPYRWLFMPGTFIMEHSLFEAVGGYAEDMRSLEVPEFAARLASYCRHHSLGVRSTDEVLLDVNFTAKRSLDRAEQAWLGVTQLLERHGAEMSREERARFQFKAAHVGIIAGKGRVAVPYAWRGLLGAPTPGRILHSMLMTLSPARYADWWRGRVDSGQV